LEMQHDIVFDAVFNDYWYSHLSDNGHVYNVGVTLSLDNGNTCVSQDVVYSILCKSYIS